MSRSILSNVATLALLVFSVAACGGHFNPALSGSGQQGASRGESRRVVTSPSLIGRSADNAYQIRTLHSAGLTVHQSIATVTAAGTFTQIDYMTPLGVLTLVQAPKQVPHGTRNTPTTLRAQATDAGSTTQTNSTQLDVVAAGTTSHGAQWFAYVDPSGNAYDIHADFGDSTIDTNVPKSVSLALIKSTVEVLY